MTATPVSQSYEKIFSMARIIDCGKSLGTNKQAYLNAYFDSDYMGYHLTLKGFADAQIMDKVRSLVHLVTDDKAKTLPTLRQEVIKFDMPAKTRTIYNEMKRHMVVGDIEAAQNAGVNAVAATWGWQSSIRLKSKAPDLMFEKPQALHDYFKNTHQQTTAKTGIPR